MMQAGSDRVNLATYPSLNPNRNLQDYFTED